MAAHTIERRPLGALGRMSLVAAIHVAVLLGIMQSMGMGTKIKEPPPIEGTMIPEELHVDDPPPLPNPDWRPTDSRVQPPDTTQVDFERDVISPPDEVVIEGPPIIEQPPRVELIGVRQDPRNPLTQPPYPSSMVRQGNEGTVELELYVLPTGRVGDARVVKSTGWDDLDRSAIAEAKRYWRLLPAMRNGEPIAQWHRLKVTFKLKDGSN